MSDYMDVNNKIKVVAINSMTKQFLSEDGNKEREQTIKSHDKGQNYIFCVLLSYSVIFVANPLYSFHAFIEYCFKSVYSKILHNSPVVNLDVSLNTLVIDVHLHDMMAMKNHLFANIIS